MGTLFVALLLILNVGTLWHLVTHTSAGGLAVFVLWIHVSVLFAAVQFGYRVMQMGRSDVEEAGHGPVPSGRGNRAPSPVMAESRVPRIRRACKM